MPRVNNLRAVSTCRERKWHFARCLRSLDKPFFSSKSLKIFLIFIKRCPGVGEGHSLIWAIRGRAVGQGMVFWPRCPKQGIQFDLPLS